MRSEKPRYEVDSLWVDSVLTASVPIDWQDAYDENCDGWQACEAPECPSCGEYGVWNASEYRWECGNGSCDNPPVEIEDDSDGPMMNYHYPLERLRQDSPQEAAELIADLPLCVVTFEDESVSLALTGGGMDLSWEICEAFARLGWSPPFRFASDLPNMAGYTAKPELVAACRRSCEIVRDWGARAVEKFDSVEAVA